MDITPLKCAAPGDLITEVDTPDGPWYRVILVSDEVAWLTLPDAVEPMPLEAAGVVLRSRAVGIAPVSEVVAGDEVAEVGSSLWRRVIAVDGAVHLDDGSAWRRGSRVVVRRPSAELIREGRSQVGCRRA